MLLTCGCLHLHIETRRCGCRGSGFRWVEEDVQETDVGVGGGSMILSAAAIRGSTPANRVRDLMEGPDTALPVRKMPTKRWDGCRSGNSTPTRTLTKMKMQMQMDSARPTPSPTRGPGLRHNMLPLSLSLITSPPLESWAGVPGSESTRTVGGCVRGERV